MQLNVLDLAEAMKALDGNPQVCFLYLHHTIVRCHLCQALQRAWLYPVYMNIACWLVTVRSVVLAWTSTRMRRQLRQPHAAPCTEVLFTNDTWQKFSSLRSKLSITATRLSLTSKRTESQKPRSLPTENPGLAWKPMWPLWVMWSVAADETLLIHDLVVEQQFSPSHNLAKCQKGRFMPISTPVYISVGNSMEIWHPMGAPFG